MPDREYVQYQKGITRHKQVGFQNEIRITPILWTSWSFDKDNQESLKMEMLKSETFLLEMEYVNMEENTDGFWTEL